MDYWPKPPLRLQVAIRLRYAQISGEPVRFGIPSRTPLAGQWQAEIFVFGSVLLATYVSQDTVAAERIRRRRRLILMVVILWFHHPL